MATQSTVELLAPAGDWECARAAVENGADAIYFGLQSGFNARARATNLHVEELPELMAFLRSRGVKGYVTLNTLVFPRELPAIQRAIVQLTEAAIDAVLVQDLGLIQLIRAISPDLPIHASTQMTLTSAECIQAVERLGVERVVLARELSVAEISDIHRQTAVELEVFVHGALCVAYSGQCLTSESLGGRSANRGQCAQACRLPYDLICDDQDIDLEEMKYLLSPQDLAAYDLIPELIAAGVRCLKIEGRLKSPEYVANITGHYRRALDAALAQREIRFTSREVREMELSFSRGFSPGWLNGSDHKMLVPGLSSAKRGVLIGEVREVRGRRIAAELCGPLAPGDGVVFAGNREQGQEQGGRIYEVTSRGKQVQLSFGRDAVDMSQLYPGQEIWKTDDPQLTSRLRKTFSGPDPLRRVKLELQVAASVGQPLRVVGDAENGASCSLESTEPLEQAMKHPLTEDVLRQQLGRLGGTVFELGGIATQIDGQPMVPLSVLGRVRREMIAQLEQSTRSSAARRIRPQAIADLLPATPTADDRDQVPPTLRVLCRSLLQLNAVLALGATRIYADFQDIREYRQAVASADQHHAELFLATPRIQKPDEAGIFRVMSRHGAAGFLVRNLAGSAYCIEHHIPYVCDFSLNAANPLAVNYLLGEGAERVTISYDLNRDQVLDLVAVAAPQRLEVVIHQHMPMFHMEHCVFCAVLSPGTNKTNCGRPCDRHQVQLRDRVGMEHTLLADVGCRNTLFNAVPQSAAEVVPSLVESGLREFRLELLNDSGRDLRRLISLYQRLLDGNIAGKEVWQQLKASNRVGVTRGTLEERRNPLTII